MLRPPLSVRSRIGPRRQRRCVSFRSNSSSSSNGPPVVVQGPSVIQTSLPRPNPSMISVPGLRSLPFWTSYDPSTNTNRVAYQDEQITSVVHYFEQHAPTMHQEYQEANTTSVQQDYRPDVDDPPHAQRLHKGDWHWHSYMTKGQVAVDKEQANNNFSTFFPQTTKIMQTFDQKYPHTLLQDIPFGYAFFSKLGPQSEILPHTSALNFRLRLHLGLQVPTFHDNDNDLPDCAIQVAGVVREWHPYQALVLDDSYVHSVWNHATRRKEDRIIFLVDVWHPDVHVDERLEIVHLFQQARQERNVAQEKDLS